MLNTFIKNKGITKTIIHNNNKNYVNEIDWDADYDGEIAKISLNVNDNGKIKHFDTKMNNDELAEILNVPSVNTPIDKRLYNDFLGKPSKKLDNHNMVLIYKIPKNTKNNTKKKVKFIDSMDSLDSLDSVNSINPSNILDTFEYMKPKKQQYTHISSPISSESLLFPLELQKNAKKTHRRHRHYNKRSNKTNRTSSKNTKRHQRKTHNYSRRTF